MFPPPNIDVDFVEFPPNIPLLGVVVTLLVVPKRFLEAVETPPNIEFELVVGVAPNNGVEVFSWDVNEGLDVVEVPKVPADDFWAFCKSFLNIDVF